MPYLIEHIDAIARRLSRDVLFVMFHTPRKQMPENQMEKFEMDTGYDWKNSLVRKNLIIWLAAQKIEWFPCGHVANTSIMVNYLGQIYIDLPYDPASVKYRSVEQYLELPDGSMRYSEATFCMLGLKMAMENAAHDEPGFWDRWAENF